MKNLRNITLTALLSLLVLASIAQSPNYFKLTISDNNDYDETAIVFNENATHDYDKYYDGTKLFHPDPNVVQIYSIDDRHYPFVLNSFPVITENTTINLGYNIGSIREAKIVLSTENLQSPLIIYLLDKETGKMINMIKEKEYTFTTTTTGKNEDRFAVKLVYVPGAPSTSIVENNLESLNIYNHNNKVFFQNPNIVDGQVIIYSLNGNILFEGNTIPESIAVSTQSSQMIIVKVYNDKYEITKKLMM